MIRFSVVKWEKVWWTVSAILCSASVIAMLVSFVTIKTPLKPSLDFVGGTRLQLELDCSIPNNCREITTDEIRTILFSQGLENSSIQVVGESKQALSIRTKTLDVNSRTVLEKALSEKIGKFDPKSTQIDTVGPTIGKELFTNGMLALLVSFFGIAVYLTIRFQSDYAFFAIVALVHDVLVTLGVFAVLGMVSGVEVDSLFVVSLLTIIGFSVNDTVVIYDRVREIAQNSEENTSIDTIIDNAVNDTLTRSINTTLTTLFPLTAIFLFGGDTLKTFSLALIVGFICGAYSSIFIASTLLGWWRKLNFNKEKSLPIADN